MDNADVDSDAAEDITEKKEEEDPAEVCIIDVNSTEVELNHNRIGKMENFEELVMKKESVIKCYFLMRQKKYCQRYKLNL